MREAASYDAVVKGGKYLEAFASADTIVFDKTGTLTNAVPVVVDVVTFNDFDRDYVLKTAASRGRTRRGQVPCGSRNSNPLFGGKGDNRFGTLCV